MIQVDVVEKGSECLLTLGGELSIYSADSLFNEHIKPLEKNKNIRIDLSGVDEIDTAGIQILLALKRALEGNQASLILSAVSPAVEKYLELFQLESEFVADDP